MTPDGSAACNGMKIIETKEYSDPSLYDLFLLADPSREMIERYIREGHTFVGMHEDRVIAAIVLVFTASDVVEIKNVAVLPEHQGKGIGSLLIRFAIEWAQKNGSRSIVIGTGNSSLTQLSLYQKLGFRMDHIIKDFFTDNYAEPIVENGLLCRDMVVLTRDLQQANVPMTMIP